MQEPLYVTFLWHMHQPFYRDASSGDFALPWTRLHATKDYLHMAEVLEDYPEIHATVNFVPSLIEQLQDYAAGYGTDRALRIGLKDQFSAADKEFLLSFFFSINWDRVINRYPAYRELLRQRQEAQGDWRRFPDQYWLDLIVWFNLAWFDFGYVQRDAELRALAAKGAGFSQADIRLVSEKSRNVAAPTLAAYRRLAERGQIELSTSPYYHPILPLLVDSSSASEATPGIHLPGELFAYPEDALEQTRLALIAHERTFGRPPQGMWPAEGAVSQDVVELLAQHTDLRWLASDEAILARSLGIGVDRDGDGHIARPGVFYQPYAVSTGPRAHGAAPLAVFFRDHLLSDRIGFVYQHMDSRAAAQDMVDRLRRARANLGETGRPHCLSIILDGENCWEYYENNGDDFLRSLYQLLTAAGDIKTVTMSEYLDHAAPRSVVPRLAAGSWIGGDFLTWIGEPAQNRGWDYLARVREQLAQRAANDQAVSTDVIGQAWKEFYVAEGSDWFWWYSSRNNPNSDVFDTLFRGYLSEVYRNLGLPAPEWLGERILVQREEEAGRSPRGYISPTLSAAGSAGPAWANAGLMEPSLSSATMQRSESGLRSLYYGYDAKNLYLRIELNPVGMAARATVYASTPRARANRTAPLLPLSVADAAGAVGWSHELSVDLLAHSAILREANGYEGWQERAGRMSAAIEGALCELRIPLTELKLRLGDNLTLVLLLGRDSVVEERQPRSGYLAFRLTRYTEQASTVT